MPALAVDYGTGADGAADFDGSSAVAGFTFSGQSYTADRAEPAVYNFTDITIADGSRVQTPQGVSLWLKHTGTFHIQSGGEVRGNGRGGSPGAGAGGGATGVNGGSGAGYGGAGTTTNTSILAGMTYGTADLAGAWTIDDGGSKGGRGGGNTADTNVGGVGGAAFRSSGWRTIIDGSIEADGDNGESGTSAGAGGAGSGGGVLIEAHTINGSGEITADGGNGGSRGSDQNTRDGGSGGGGRIRRNAVVHSFTGTSSVIGGTRGSNTADSGTSTTGQLSLAGGLQFL